MDMFATSSPSNLQPSMCTEMIDAGSRFVQVLRIIHSMEMPSWCRTFADGFVWYSPNPEIKCLNNVFLPLYFHGYITITEFSQLHHIIARDQREITSIVWDALGDCPRTQEPIPGDI